MDAYVKITYVIVSVPTGSKVRSWTV